MGVFRRTIKGKDGKKEYWYIDYVLDAKRKWESVGQVGRVSKEHAKKLLALRKTEILQGKFNAPKPKTIPTLSEFAKEYLEFEKGNKKSWDRDMYAVIRLMPFFGSYRLKDISPILIEKYKLERKQGVSNRTVNIELSLLRRMLNLAVSWDKCESNPVSKVKFFKEAPPKERILTLEEEKALLESSPSHLKPVLITALNTGMRYGELLNLTWNDVDFDSGYIHVRQSKSGRSRKKPMNETVRETLLELESENFVSNSVSSGFDLAKKTKDYRGVLPLTHVPVKPEVSGSSPVGPVFKKSELTGIFSIQPFRLLHKKSSSHPYAGSL
ncbi:MAG TPA: tyrosine-type recombinase/integrase [Thermodesulfobacteriota bacterium]|nr:tyrosine-type recombinase/integrase [Thermodesulfobacteriota bacterium]